MKKTITLKNPILINGKQVNEFNYDSNEITAIQFSEACAKSAALTKKNSSISIKFRENDYALHLYLGFMSIVAVNPSIDITDLERIKGDDVIEVTDIGLLFITRTSEGNSQENDSDVQSENTVDTFTQV